MRRVLSLTGGSMRPLLSSGDAVEVKKVEPARLYPGDIAAYRVQNRLLVHRFAFSTSAGLWFFDDGATVGWHRVPIEALVGRIELEHPLAHGWLGLVYGMFVSTAYFVLRIFLET